MALRNGHPITFQPTTLSDTIDGTNNSPGAMAVLQNLVPSPLTRNQWVPRPAAMEINDFSTSGYTVPQFIEAQFTSGSRIYGMVATAGFGGTMSQPFCYDTSVPGFVTIAGQTAGNLPTQTLTGGDWQPPKMVQAGGRILVTHPGFNGANGAFGWIDMTGFSSTTLTATTTAGDPVLTVVSSNPLLAGVRPGQTISGMRIPPNTRVVSVDGTSLTITMSQAASGNGAFIALTIAGGTPAAPLWASGNTNNGGGSTHQGRALASPPISVDIFNGRAYYSVPSTATGNIAALDFSDPNDPLLISDNPNTQAITFQNNLNVTALSGIPYTNLQGGIVSSLIAFQGAAAIWQITGDPTTNNLALNLLLHGCGTLAPNSIDVSPLGLLFVAPDGLRQVSLQGTVTPVIGSNGDGVALPFINAQTPSRMAGAWNSDTYRVAVLASVSPAMIWGVSQWGVAIWGPGTPTTQEYWYHTKLNVWSGPHTLSSSLLSASGDDTGFLVTSTAMGAKLLSSSPFPVPGSSYTENGNQLICVALTALLPDQGDMAMNSLLETTIGLGASVQTMVTVSFLRDADQRTLGEISITVQGSATAVWGQFVWGAANWGAAGSRYAQYRVPWSNAIFFKQGQIGVSFGAAGGMVLGNIYMRYQRLGYMQLGMYDAA